MTDVNPEHSTGLCDIMEETRVEDDDGDHSTDTSVPAPAKGADDGAVDLGGSRDAVERSDRSVGAESDSGHARHADGSELEESSEEEHVRREIVREASLEAMEMLVSSGPIADAENFYQYTPEHQERLIRMAEGPRTDESARRDRLVAAQTIVIKRGQWIQATLFGASFAAAAVSFWGFHEPWGATFLSLPVMQAIGSIVRSTTKGRD